MLHFFVFTYLPTSSLLRCAPQAKLEGVCTYLEDTPCVVEGITFYGSPWQPEFWDWGFNLPRGEPCRQRWQDIPNDVDVLVTHGPALGYSDRTSNMDSAGGRAEKERDLADIRNIRNGVGCIPSRVLTPACASLRLGCVDLLREIQLRVQPQLHIFGHIHGEDVCSYSSPPCIPSSPHVNLSIFSAPPAAIEAYGISTDGRTVFANASTCDLSYEPEQRPFVFDVFPRDRAPASEAS